MPARPRGAMAGLTWVGHGGDEEGSGSVHILVEMPQEVPKARIRVSLAGSVLVLQRRKAQDLAQQS